MHPEIHGNVLSVFIAAAAAFAFGWIWHGPILGKVWEKFLKIPMDNPKGSKMMKSMIIEIVALLLISHVMVYSTNIWRMSVWTPGSTDLHWCKYAFWSGFYTWLGFYIPMNLSSVAWERRSWKMFGFIAVYSFLMLQIIASIVAYMYGMQI